jgi:hypothetical protein
VLRHVHCFVSTAVAESAGDVNTTAVRIEVRLWLACLRGCVALGLIVCTCARRCCLVVARRPLQPKITSAEARKLVNDLAQQQDQRTFTLPRTLRVSDVVQCYNMIWDMEEGYGD